MGEGSEAKKQTFLGKLEIREVTTTNTAACRLRKFQGTSAGNLEQ